MAEDSSEVVREMAESVAASNLKVLGDSPAVSINLATQNAVSNQQAMNQLQLAIVGKVTETLIATDPREGGADNAALMMLGKMAGNMPPVTP